MLAIVDECWPKDLACYRSSLGGYLAALAAERRPTACTASSLRARLRFVTRGRRVSVPRRRPLARSRSRSRLPLRAGPRSRCRSHSSTTATAIRRSPDPPVSALIFAGRHDDAVPLDVVQHFAAVRPERRELVVFERAMS